MGSQRALHLFPVRGLVGEEEVIYIFGIYEDLICNGNWRVENCSGVSCHLGICIKLHCIKYSAKMWKKLVYTHFRLRKALAEYFIKLGPKIDTFVNGNHIFHLRDTSSLIELQLQTNFWLKNSNGRQNPYLYPSM